LTSFDEIKSLQNSTLPLAKTKSRETDSNCILKFKSNLFEGEKTNQSSRKIKIDGK